MPFAVVDIETTGLDRENDRIVEIGIILLSASLEIEAEWSSLIFPERSVGATSIHGISDDDVASAPSFAEVAPKVVELLRGRRLVAHNVRFDIDVLNAEFARTAVARRIPYECGVCTMNQSRIYLPPGPHSLAGIAQRTGISVSARHRSLADARTAHQLLKMFVEFESAGQRYADIARDRNDMVVRPREWERASTWLAPSL